MELFLIRHAQSLNNARPEEEREEDPALTELGRRQAASLADWIRCLQLTRIRTSPFLRALQTAEYLVRATSLWPEVRIDLHEQGGCMSGPRPEVMVGRPGLTRAQINQQFPGFHVEAAIDGAGWWASKPHESEDRARERAVRLIAHTQQEFGHTSERVAYVMHADFKRLLVGHVSPEPLEVPYNTSVTRLRITSDVVRLEQYNLVSHLSPELVSL